MTETDPLLARYGKVLAAGEVVFREGEPGNHMFVIHAGRVRISKAIREGQKTLAILGPGEFFGEMSILNDKPRNATAEVVEDAHLLRLNAKTFEAMVVGRTEIAVRLIKKLARRLDAMDALMEILVHRDARVRVILGLSREAERLGVAQSDGSILVPVSEEDLAEQVGMSPSEVRDVIARLSRLRIVEPFVDTALPTEEQTQAPGYILLDRRRLDEFLEFIEQQSAHKR